MASFDIVSKVDLNEVNNVVNSVNRELSNRYDFKGSKFTINLNEKENSITIQAPDNYKLEQIGQSIKTYSVKRGINPESYEFKDEEKAGGDSLRQNIIIKQGIDKDVSKKINKFIKDKKMKIQSSVRGDEMRVEGKKIDDLQEMMTELKKENFGAVLQFINFR